MSVVSGDPYTVTHGHKLLLSICNVAYCCQLVDCKSFHNRALAIKELE